MPNKRRVLAAREYNTPFTLGADLPFTPPLTVDETNAALGNMFRVTESIASGGQGAVFKGTISAANYGNLGAAVALKIYFDDQVEERTQREIAALGRMQGASLVKLLGSGRCVIRGQQCIYIATEFIAGEPLASAIARNPLDWPVVAQTGHDISMAIDEMWRNRIVHRDIKPGNIMLRPDGRAVLIDLGLARHLSLGAITSAGVTWGTAGYLSPEHAAGRAVTCKSDVFSLGIVMQEALWGRHPTGRRQSLLPQAIPSTAGLRAGLPSALVTLVDSMVHPSPVHRPMPAVVAARLAALIGVLSP